VDDEIRRLFEEWWSNAPSFEFCSLPKIGGDEEIIFFAGRESRQQEIDALERKLIHAEKNKTAIQQSSLEIINSLKAEIKQLLEQLNAYEDDLK